MQAAAMPLSHTHTLLFHSCKCALLTHFFFKGNKKTLDYSGTMGESRSPRQQAESRVCVCGIMGGVTVSEVLILGKVGGATGAAVAFD